MSTSRLRILITIDWFLPGYKAGGPIQSCANLVKHLKGDFDFFILTRNTDYSETKPYEQVQPDTWTELEEHVQVYYFSGDNLKYKQLRDVVQSVKPDIAFVNGIYSFYFSILPLFILKRLKHTQVIVSARGMLAQSAINVKGGKKKLFLRAGKLAGLYKGIRFHATNEGEKKDIQAVLGKDVSVIVAPNLPKLTAVVANAQRAKEKGELNLVSVARIAPEKNLKYALDVLAQYKGKGKIRFDIFGPVYDVPYWKACEEVIHRLPDNVTVTYKGSIESEKVAEMLAQYHALLMPTLGENFGHIILESFTAGCPVIISDQTPWKNLKESKLGFDLPLAQPDSFVAAIELFVNQSREEYSEWSEQAYLYGQKFNSNEEAVRLNRQMFR